MNVLILDLGYFALDFALRCKEYGHKVKLYRHPTLPLPVGKGMGIDTVDDWRKHMSWARDGLIWVTYNDVFLPELDRYKEMGCKIFVPSARAAELEIKREKGMKLLQACEIPVPMYKEFNSMQSAFDFAFKSDQPWVFKALGNSVDKSSTYVADNPADLCSWLERKIEAGKDTKCILQEKVDLCCEMAITGIFGPDGFLEHKWLESFEHKKLMSGDSGCNTGEMGTVGQYCRESNLAEEVLVPLAPALHALGHVGFVDVNCGIDTSGHVWPFEFTVRPGWPLFYLQTEQHYGDPAQWMKDLLDGKDTLRVSYDPTAGIVLGIIPRFPYEGVITAEMTDGFTISGIEENMHENIHPVGVMCGKGIIMRDGKVARDNSVWQTVGQHILTVTARAKTMTKAKDKVYGIADKVTFPNKTIRDDIGEKVIETLPKLQAFGYAEEFSV